MHSLDESDSTSLFSDLILCDPLPAVFCQYSYNCFLDYCLLTRRWKSLREEAYTHEEEVCLALLPALSSGRSLKNSSSPLFPPGGV